MSFYGRAFIGAMGIVPKKGLSRMVGGFASSSASRSLIAGFARRYGVNMDDAERTLSEYTSLQDFFTRRLKPGVRPVDPDPRVLVSPADGVVDESGSLDGGELVQAKGRRYTLAALLGSEARAKQFAGGQFATVYLSPKDYHRVHSPVAGRVVGATYVPGRLYPVNPHAVEHVEALFATNERIVTHLVSEVHGPVAVAMVGATIVGSVEVVYDAELRTNTGGDEIVERSYDTARLERGGELGVFKMGSTAIVVVGPSVRFDPIAKGTAVRVGERIGAVA